MEEKFLKYDKGRKDYTITIKVQYEIIEELEKITANKSRFVRELIIQHIRRNKGQ